jgi:hypothetical protein
MLMDNPTHPLARLWKKLRGPVTLAAYLGVVRLAIVTKGLSQYDRRVVVLGYPLLAFAFASTIYALVDRPSEARTLWPFGSPVLRACGKLSYGMYVLHWPLAYALIPLSIQLERFAAPFAAALGGAIIATGMVVAYGGAWVSYRLLEQPFLKLKSRLPNRSYFRLTSFARHGRHPARLASYFVLPFVGPTTRPWFVSYAAPPRGVLNGCATVIRSTSVSPSRVWSTRIGRVRPTTFVAVISLAGSSTTRMPHVVSLSHA